MKETAEKQRHSFGNVYAYHSGEWIREATEAELLLTLRSVRDFREGDKDGAWFDVQTNLRVYVADEDEREANRLITAHDLDAPVAELLKEQAT